MNEIQSFIESLWTIHFQRGGISNLLIIQMNQFNGQLLDTANLILFLSDLLFINKAIL